MPARVADKPGELKAKVGFGVGRAMAQPGRPGAGRPGLRRGHQEVPPSSAAGLHFLSARASSFRCSTSPSPQRRRQRQRQPPAPRRSRLRRALRAAGWTFGGLLALAAGTGRRRLVVAGFRPVARHGHRPRRALPARRPDARDARSHRLGAGRRAHRLAALAEPDARGRGERSAHRLAAGAAAAKRSSSWAKCTRHRSRSSASARPTTSLPRRSTSSRCRSTSTCLSASSSCAGAARRRFEARKLAGHYRYAGAHHALELGGRGRRSTATTRGAPACRGRRRWRSSLRSMAGCARAAGRRPQPRCAGRSQRQGHAGHGGRDACRSRRNSSRPRTAPSRRCVPT